MAIAHSAAVDADGSITIGVTGQRRRWSVSPWGAVQPWSDPTAIGRLEWFVAADDRWHVPGRESSVRQQRLDGTPVVETRVRVPEGDVVQRTWAVPDSDGSVIVEFENASPLPLAVALTGDAIVTERPPADVPVEGIDLDEPAIVLPIGHHSTVRVALGDLTTPTNAPPPLSVVRGWTRVVEQASRLVLPDPTLSDSIVAARCDLLLEGPVDVEVDPTGFLLDVGELVRCGDAAEPWLVDMVEPAERLIDLHRPGRRRRGPETLPVDVREALLAVRRVAVAADDRRAAGDLERTLAGLPPVAAAEPVSLAELRRDRVDRNEPAGSIGRFVRRVERRFLADRDLLPGGVPSSWLGADFEAHGLPTDGDTAIGFAVRWHGARPAVLWEQRGEPVTLTAASVDPGWSTDRPSGEALWQQPSNAALARRPIAVAIELAPDDDGS